MDIPKNTTATICLYCVKDELDAVPGQETGEALAFMKMKRCYRIIYLKFIVF